MFMCEICRVEKAIYQVDIQDASDLYKYKTTYRCESCKDKAEASHACLQVKKL